MASVEMFLIIKIIFSDQKCQNFPIKTLQNPMTWFAYFFMLSEKRIKINSFVFIIILNLNPRQNQFRDSRKPVNYR